MDAEIAEVEAMVAYSTGREGTSAISVESWARWEVLPRGGMSAAKGHEPTSAVRVLSRYEIGVLTWGGECNCGSFVGQVRGLL